MKTIRIITIFLALCIALGACAKASPKAPRRAKNKKEYPHAEIMVSYLCHEEHLKTDAKAYTAEYQMILLANGTESKFYNAKCEYIDSLRSTPSGKRMYREIFSNISRKYAETGVFDDSEIGRASCRERVCLYV